MAKTRISRPEFVGSTVYVVVWNDSDQGYNGSTFVTYTTTQDTFDQGAATVPANGIVSYTLPAGAAYWKWFVQSGGTADFDDQDIAYGDHEQEVTGDIGGKVLGGGSGTIAGTGARADLPDAPNPTAVEAIQQLTASAATKLNASADTMIIGTVNDANFTPTTTEFRVTGITDAEENQYKNRRLIVTSGTLIRQVTSITASSLVSGETHFTVSPALTQALADGDTVLVV